MKKRYVIGVIIVVIIVIFTLLAILSTGILVALNPAKNLAEARNSVRQTDINMLSNAIESYSYDIYISEEQLPEDFFNIPQCTEDADPILLGGFLDKAFVGDYLVELPYDPLIEKEGKDTGYAICMNGEKVYIFAPLAEDL